jgi:hypothetical protein
MPDIYTNHLSRRIIRQRGFCMSKRSRTVVMKNTFNGDIVRSDRIHVHTGRESFRGRRGHPERRWQKTSDIPILPIPSSNQSQPTTNVAPPRLSFYNPIEIGSDADLVTFANDHGYPGNGSSDNPYLLDGIYISFNYYTYGTALAIHDTTLHFIISNSTFYNAKFSSSPYQIGAGIMLSNVPECGNRELPDVQ